MKITDLNKCSGCSLCEWSCPTKAINIKYLNDSLFYYPVINEEKCIKCGKCISICPSNNVIELLKQKKCFIAQTKEKELLKTVTSGGIASSISKQFIKNGGIVYGAAFTRDMYVEHIRCDSEEKCELIKGSKYIQSNVSNIYKAINQDLINRISVLFIGTPCQCIAMKKMFSKYSNFYCCDFVCNGVASPKIFISHIKNLERIYRCKIKNYIFRPKTKKYLEPYEVFNDINGKKYRIKSPWKKWGSIYYAGLAMRSSCYNCIYTSNSRVGDITFSDISLKLMEKMKEKLFLNISIYGASHISINSEKGIKLLQMVKEKVFLENVEEYIVDKNKHIKHNFKIREEFCKIANISLEEAKLKYLGKKMKMKGLIIDIIEFIKNNKEK